MLRHTRLAGVLFLTASLAFPRRDIQLCGSYPARGAEELALHRRAAPMRMAKQSAARLAASPARAQRDIGNIAILEDADGVVERRNPFNLAGRSVRFTRDSGSYRFASSAGGYDASIAQAGTRLEGLGDDDTRNFTLPFAFPFYGATYDRIFVNSDGNLTFGAGDTATSDRSLGRLTAGAPRIAAFFEDLDPSAAGEVRVTSQPGFLAVSWVGVSEYSASLIGPRNTFQVVLFPDGRIDLAYDVINTRSAVAGIAPGSVQGETSVVSFNTTASANYNGAVAERFSNVEEIDTVFAAQKFYETHEDVYDYLVFYNNLDIAAAPGAVAFESSVRSDRLGIGDSLVNNGREYGSPRRLQAIMNMGQLTQYPRDPSSIVPARGSTRDTPLTVLGHEAGHLWLAFASVRDAANPAARPMLGRQTAHWAFNFNSEASLLEGNRIQDNGPGVSPRFRTVATVEGYAPLDQYLMGFRAPDEVPPTFVVTGSPGFLPSAPQTGISFNGDRRDVTVADIIAAEGRRTPDHTVSQRRFRFAFVLVVAANREPTADQVSQVETYREAFPAFFERASGGRASAESTLLQNLQLSLAPTGGILAGASATASVSVQQPAVADLTVLLRTANGVASAPASVTIRAGERRATFAVQGVRVGVEELAAEPADTRYATAFARLQVNSAAALRLTAVSGDVQTVPAPGTALPQALVIRVVDANNVPYAGQMVNATVTSGSVNPARAIADEDGFARFTWTPAAGPLYELRAAIGSATLTMSAVGKPFISSGAIVNSASFIAGVAPRALVTIFGASLAGGITGGATTVPLPNQISGVRVTMNGQPASLVFVSDRQINLVAPSNLAGNTAEVVVTWGAESITTTVPLKTVDPAIFVIDGARSGAVLIAGTGQTTLTRPAMAGDVLEIYSTGLGEPSARPTVTLGGRDAEVLFAGPTPSFPGLDQINIRVPAGLAAGSQPLVVRIGSVTSNEVLVRLR